MEFCKEFNAATQDMEPGMPVPVVITAYRRPHLHLHHQDAAQHLLPQEGGEIDKGSHDAGKARPSAGHHGRSCREIAEQKMKDMNANDVEGAVRMLAGSARSMGLTVVEG